ncbi:MAG: 16S rRNA (cytidine(1402)-2'-O)-methyltransferase [Chloroflexi bacterium HGW-Chloroflexi-3]|nr:MAG: 16S rRNA (cytidine(1402)-2'-O)-methyltransferase [Chloroflexi bacterium HGW-Chloroflexi-3]
MNNPGKLYIVSTPIGNWDDITIRALKILKDVDLLVCEEFRVGSTLLKKLSLPPKVLIDLNEHNENEQVGIVIQELFEGANIALISDCGTPVFADPGHVLINQATQMGIEVVPIPGVSSLMAALSVLDFKLDRFYFAGFLPREKDLRKAVLNSLRSMDVPIILMDTPYRLQRLLEEVSQTFGKNRRITLGINITMENEKFLRGTVAEIIKQLNQKKAEFILVVHAK